jgi:hypothetical protein
LAAENPVSASGAPSTFHADRPAEAHVPNDESHDPWLHPPDWVPLADVPKWVEHQYKVSLDDDFKRDLIQAIKSNSRDGLIYRIADLPYDRARDGYPGGFGTDRGNNLIVENWDAVDPSWQDGTVAGWRTPGSEPKRHEIQFQWDIRFIIWARRHIEQDWDASAQRVIAATRARGAATPDPSQLSKDLAKIWFKFDLWTNAASTPTNIQVEAKLSGLSAALGRVAPLAREFQDNPHLKALLIRAAADELPSESRTTLEPEDQVSAGLEGVLSLSRWAKTELQKENHTGD